MGNINTRKYIR